MALFGGIFALLFVFGGPAAWRISVLVRQLFEHRERMQEKLNEELRLQIQLVQVRRGHSDGRSISFSPDPLPKDVSWNEQVLTSYEMGYQQIS